VVLCWYAYEASSNKHFFSPIKIAFLNFFYKSMRSLLYFCDSLPRLFCCRIAVNVEVKQKYSGVSAARTGLMT